MSTFVQYLHSPVGWLHITASDDTLRSVLFVEEKGSTENPNSLTQAAMLQLTEYFTAGRKAFELPLAPVGSPFQQRVWQQLQHIPFGQTASYSEVALELDDIKSVRAVGAANGQNPISIIIPCHRVIGADGSLTGYGGGLWRKRWLLDHEQANRQQQLF